jgi:hypothetical protein
VDSIAAQRAACDVAGVQVVIVSSPGRGPAPHWSRERAAALATAAAAAGRDVRWLVGMHADEPPPPPCGHGVQVLTFRGRARLPLARVAKSCSDGPLELALTESLRARPDSAVVHVGLGAGGTPNALWLADRLGSPTWACVRGDELVCHRGDLLDRDKRVCEDWDDAERCRWCVSSSWWSAPRADDLRNRADLIVAALQTCAAIAVPAPRDAARVEALGVSAEKVRVGDAPAQLLKLLEGAAGSS